MATNKVKFEADIDEETAKKIKNEVKSWGKSKNAMCQSSNAGGGAVYGLGLIGALFYFWGNAGNFWDVFWGLLKAIVWPAYMVFELFKFLGL